MCAIPQLVSAPLNPIPIAEHFRRSHPQCDVITDVFYLEISGTSYSRPRKCQCFCAGAFVHSNRRSRNTVFENC